jgi:hypothetical protein
MSVWSCTTFLSCLSIEVIFDTSVTTSMVRVRSTDDLFTNMDIGCLLSCGCVNNPLFVKSLLRTSKTCHWIRDILIVSKVRNFVVHRMVWSFTFCLYVPFT